MVAEERSAQGGGEYPGADLAYDIAVEAYRLSERRWDAVHRRIDALLTFVTTITVAAFVAIEALVDTVGLDSPLLIAAGSCYLVNVALLLGARSLGSIAQLTPAALNGEWLSLEERDFRLRVFYWSARDNAQALRLISLKHRIALVATMLVFAEAALLLLGITL